MMIVLTIINLGLLFSFIWQAYQSSYKHLRVSQSVLQDYAKMAAQRFASQIKSQIGYWALHDLRSQLLISQHEPQRMVDAYFNQSDSSLKPQQRLIRSGIKSIDHYVLNTTLLQRLYNHDNAVAGKRPWLSTYDFESVDDFMVVHPNPESGLTTVAIMFISEDDFLIIEFSKNMIKQAVASSFKADLLLPEVLASKLSDHDDIFLSLQVKGYEPIFQHGLFFDPYLFSVVEMNDDYGHLFESYQVKVALNEDIADQLIIGGVPNQNLLKLILLFLLTLFVLVATYLAYRKEQRFFMLRAQFIARVSHELRTPLTQIRMFAETILLNRVADDEQRHEYLSIIHNESQRLSYLTDNILRMHEYQNHSDHQHNETINIAQKMHQIVLRFDHVMVKRKIAIHINIDDDLILWTDHSKFFQIFMNLIDNAIKYGPDQQTICIKAEVTAIKHKKFVKIGISDQGPGIREDMHDKVWEPYFRLNRDEQRAINGTGIGLSITRENLRSMKGFCEIKCNDQTGVTFKVYLPMGEQ